MPTCPAPCATHAKKFPCPDSKRSPVGLLEPNFPASNMTNRPNMTTCPPCKGIYTWHSAPKAMYSNKMMAKVRESQPSEPYRNIMHDKRVVRGSNYSQLQTIAGGEGDCAKEAEARRRNILRKKVVRNQRGVIGTPPPVCGRKHEDVQTDKYLEELFEKPPEVEIGCQTDLFLHRPPSPPFVPGSVGVDAATEILEGELFDFDTEVQPILQTLVGYSIEQGLLEVLHEEEIADINTKQQELLTLRQADLAELRRLEAEEVRLQAEKERRLRQDSISKHLDADVQDKVTAARLLQGHIANLVPAVLKQLEPLNEAENREELELKLCPWLTQQVAEEVGNMIDSREILTAIIKEILVQRAEAYNMSYGLETDDEGLSCHEEHVPCGDDGLFGFLHSDDNLNILDYDQPDQLSSDSDLLLVSQRQPPVAVEATSMNKEDLEVVEEEEP